MSKKKFKKEIDDEKNNYTETPRERVINKLTMNEMLSADDFNELLQAMTYEFNRTFSILNSEEEKEIE